MVDRVKQFKVYLPEALIKRLKHAAIETEQSLSEMVTRAVGEHLDRLRQEGKIEDRSRHEG